MATLELTERERIALIQAANYGLYYCPPEVKAQLLSLRDKAVQAKEEDRDNG